MGCVGLSWAWGGLGSLAIVNEYQVAVLPSALSYEQGALIEPAAVAVYGIERGGVRAGDSVVITGGGPIGALAALAARAAGAGAVFLSEPNGVRARNAEALEVTEIFDPSATNVPEELRRRTGGIGVDVAVECSGNARALDDCVMSTRRGGTVVQTGLHVGPAEVRPMVWSENDLTIAGTWCYHVYDWPRIAAMIERGTFPVERIVTSHVGLEGDRAGRLRGARRSARQRGQGPRRSRLTVLTRARRLPAYACARRSRRAAPPARGDRPAHTAAHRRSRAPSPRRWQPGR
jgi:(R,R)-butanediol dehydrogenase/meso-butanediol dehydrogenase/diacetyl reductase